MEPAFRSVLSAILKLGFKRAAMNVSCRRSPKIGLHSGELIRTEICPAEPDMGVIFRRIDIVPNRDISLSNCKVTGTQLASTISENNIEISTVEHLVAALSGLGIDNVLVKVSGEEIPILDGSAAIFVHLLKSAGCREQNSAKNLSQSTEL